MRTRASSVALCAVAISTALAGCRTVDVKPPAATAAEAVTPPPPIKSTNTAELASDRTVIGRSVEGRPIEAFVRGDPAGPCVLMIASIHGNEPAGTPLLARMMDVLREDPARAHGRRVVLIPVANPDGVAARRRANANRVDLNRNFPADNFRGSSSHGGAPLSQPESRAIHALIARERPTRVVSIHMPTAQIDWDGDGEALARRMAALCPLPAKRMGSRPGSLGSWVGLTLDRPILTVELRGGDRRLDDDTLWRTYGDALLSVLE